MTSSYIPAATITPEGKVVTANQKDTKVVTVAQSEKDVNNNEKTLKDILTAINELNANLASGKIGIYLDGQLVSATIARQTAFRGGYGVNKV